MPIPSGVILFWSDTNASIPAGWSRETALDGKYPKGHGAENPAATGGSNTHTHSGNHSHSLTAHQHTYVTGDSNEWGAADYSGQSADGGENNLCAKHTHQSATNTTTSIVGGSLVSQTVTWASANQEPPYHKVIFIKPTGARASMMAKIMAHFNGAVAPTGFTFCDGSLYNGVNATPDVRNRYLKGAATGADGGTQGGGLTHSHDISHTHTVNSHYHTGNTQNNTNPYGTRQSQAPDSGHATTVHQHLTTLSTVIDTINSYSNTGAGSGDTVEPAYKKMGVVFNNAGGMERLGLVGLWLGSLAALPRGWVVCDGTNGTVDMRDKFIKIGANLAENGATGGANTHNHSPVSHTHTPVGSHSHTGSTGGALTGRERRGANQLAGIVLDYDTHPISSVSSETVSYSSDSISADTVSNQPAYTIVAYIQLVKLDALGVGSFFI